MDFKSVMERALKVNVVTVYSNTAQPVVNSVLELVKSEMKEFSANCPIDKCNFQDFTSKLAGSVNEKFPYNCSVNFVNHDLCGESQAGVINIFLFYFGNFKMLFTCYKPIPK
jgi:hypothetical protein